MSLVVQTQQAVATLPLQRLAAITDHSNKSHCLLRDSADYKGAQCWSQPVET